MPVEDAFKDPAHPFRIAIVCAMWLTGFDVESLSTLYRDKPMKAHTLMQAIARACDARAHVRRKPATFRGNGAHRYQPFQGAGPRARRRRLRRAPQRHRDAIALDLSQIDCGKLREEFATKVRRKTNVRHDIRQIVERALAHMMATNPLSMGYYRRYQEIVADYNREKDRATIAKTFGLLVTLAAELDTEQRLRRARVQLRLRPGRRRHLRQRCHRRVARNPQIFKPRSSSRRGARNSRSCSTACSAVSWSVRSSSSGFAGAS